MRTRPSVDELYRVHYERLVGLGYLLTGTPEDAEDLAQVAFAALVGAGDAVAAPAAFLRQVVVNRAQDRLRVKYRRLRAAPPGGPGPGADAAVGEPVVDETWALVRALPEVQRTVVVLRFYEDLALVQIAELLGRPESTVRSDLRRALLRLREGMAADG